jgi:hypothetical protein
MSRYYNEHFKHKEPGVNMATLNKEPDVYVPTLHAEIEVSV